MKKTTIFSRLASSTRLPAKESSPCSTPPTRSSAKKSQSTSVSRSNYPHLQIVAGVAVMAIFLVVYVFVMLFIGALLYTVVGYAFAGSNAFRVTLTLILLIPFSILGLSALSKPFVDEDEDSRAYRFKNKTFAIGCTGIICEFATAFVILLVKMVAVMIQQYSV